MRNQVSLLPPPEVLERKLRDQLREVVVWAYCLHDVATLGDLFESQLAVVYRAINDSSSPKDIDLRKATAQWRLEMDLGSSLNAVMDTSPDRLKVIAKERTLTPSPCTLADIADRFGVSRQRVSQLEARLKEDLAVTAAPAFEPAGRRVRTAFGPAVETSKLRRTCQLLLEGVSEEYRELAIHLLITSAGYQIVGDYAVTSEFADLVCQISEHAGPLFDEHGVLAEEELAAKYPNQAKTPTWELILNRAGLVRLNGYWVRRDTHKTRVVTALLALGVPATADEVARKAGLPVDSTRAALSSSHGIVRVTKNEWGLNGWTDDPYDGVAGEIVQRILENGGRARVEDLRHEISTRFRVSPSTIDAYLATTKFAVQDGWARLADLTNIELRPLAELNQVFWRDSETPVFRFIASEEYLRGHSVKVPPEVAAHLGVQPDQAHMIPVNMPDVSTTASVIWRAHDPSGPEIGRLKHVLELLAAEPDQAVYLVLDKNGLEVTCNHEGILPNRPLHPSSESPQEKSNTTPSVPATSRAQHLLEQLKSRRKI